MRVTILGCGGSNGTPSIDFGWGHCDPENPRNRRLRPSILVEQGDTRILVDTSPDLREQMLAAEIRTVDAILFTHGHADHLHGIDDLRPINRAMKRPLDIYANAVTLDDIRARFGYVFEPLAEGATMYYKPVLVPHEVSDGSCFRIGDIDVTAFDQDHGWIRTMGYRFGPIAYSSDAVEIPDHAFAYLDGIDTWIIGTLVDTPHPTHAHVGKAVEWIRRVGARHGVLTHLSSRLDYATLASTLPEGIQPAYDGLVIEAGEPR